MLVYQILPSSEVAADGLPFEVVGEYPQRVSASFSSPEVRPGDEVTLNLQTEGRAKVGIAAVDRSVFILAENRLNLQQVFAELERLYMQPQAEIHEAEPMFDPLLNPGAKDTFKDAGLLVLTDKLVPEGKQPAQSAMMFGGPWAADVRMAFDGVMAAPERGNAHTMLAPATAPASSAGLAEVQRVRQFFPETWIWDETTTGPDGAASLPFTAPDSITTWDLRAIALSPEKGLGIAETSLKVFQPFFLQADLPYSAIRGEEFPVKVALYNYLDTPQTLTVEIDFAPWFDLLDDGAKTVTVAGNDIGGAEFKIRPTTVGSQLVKITARSAEAADAVVKSLIVEPEGVSREAVENVVLSPGASRTIDLPLPPVVVPDSARAYVALTGSLLAQTIDGLDQLLQMPFGCGEQNMILFAPDVYILDYLKRTGRVKPEIQAKAELLIITGYQRELTYRRDDGSFSAFGQSDPEGSLFLTAFVLKTFAQAKGLTFVDDAVLGEAAAWITSHQKPDGSFESVGFLAHQDLMGGVRGKAGRAVGRRSAEATAVRTRLLTPSAPAKGCNGRV
ncbi:MAG: alpha-2-macroglobulin family protein [Thermoleophilia bacterium]